jgi:hypothetical protein
VSYFALLAARAAAPAGLPQPAPAMASSSPLTRLDQRLNLSSFVEIARPALWSEPAVSDGTLETAVSHAGSPAPVASFASVTRAPAGPNAFEAAHDPAPNPGVLAQQTAAAAENVAPSTWHRVLSHEVPSPRVEVRAAGPAFGGEHASDGAPTTPVGEHRELAHRVAGADPTRAALLQSAAEFRARAETAGVSPPVAALTRPELSGSEARSERPLESGATPGEPHAPSTANGERFPPSVRNALARIEAWMLEPPAAPPREPAVLAAPAARGAPAAPPRVAPQPATREPALPPRLSIGRIEIEVVPPAAAAPPQPWPAPRASSVPRSEPAAPLGRLGFGLRQG